MSQKKVIRIAVTPEAKAVVERFATENDMSEIGVASRIYEWFGAQPEAMQRTILGLLGSYGPDVAKIYMSQVADGSRGVPVPEPRQTPAAPRRRHPKQGG